MGGRPDGLALGRPTSGDAVTPPPKAAPPGAEDGHWVFIKSANDYEARLRTADALATTLAEKLSDTERSAAAQIESMQRQLSSEQARSADLDRALAGARQGAPGQAGGGSTAQASPAAGGEIATLRASLQAAARETADVRGAAAAQVDALQRRIGEEQARAAGLDRALHDARDRVTQDEKQRSAADAQAAALTSTLASMKVQVGDLQRDAAQAQDLSKALADQRTRSSDLTRDLSDARASLAKAAQKGAADGARAIAAETAAATAKGDAARLQSAREALTGRLVDLEQRAAAQAAASQKEIADQKTRIAALDQEAAEARGRLVQASDRASAADAETAALRDAQRTASEKLASTERAFSQQLGEIQGRLGAEQAKNAGLGKDLTAERARAARSEQAEAGAVNALAASNGALQALRDAGAEAERKAMAQIGLLEAQAASAEARAMALDRDMAQLRDRNSATEQARGEAERKLQAALADRPAERQSKVAPDRADALQDELEREKARAAGLGRALEAARTSLAQLETDKGKQVEETQARLGAEQAKSAGLEKDLAADRARAARLEQAEASAEAGQRTAEASAKDALAASNGALQGLRDAGVEAERKATAQMGSLKAQAASAEVRATALDDEVAKLRDRNSAAEQAKGEAERKLQVALADVKATEDLKAAARQRDALQEQLEHEKARAAGLGRDLEAVRASLARAEADKADGATAGRRRDDIDRALTAKLTEAENSAASLRARADEAARLQQASAAQLDAAKAALVQEQVRSADLGRDLAEAHSAIERAAKRRAERQVAADRVANADRDGPAIAAGLRRRSDALPDRRAPASAPAGEERTAVVPPLDGASQTTVASAATGAKLPDGAGAGSTDLPRAVEARVSLRYARDSAAARQRAVALREALRARGIDAADPVPVTASIESDRVLYYYAEDRASAERIANGLVRKGPIRRKVGKQSSPLPKPGTIEVSVAG